MHCSCDRCIKKSQSGTRKTTRSPRANLEVIKTVRQRVHSSDGVHRNIASTTPSEKMHRLHGQLPNTHTDTKRRTRLQLACLTTYHTTSCASSLLLGVHLLAAYRFRVSTTPSVLVGILRLALLCSTRYPPPPQKKKAFVFVQRA